MVASRSIESCWPDLYLQIICPSLLLLSLLLRFYRALPDKPGSYPCNTASQVISEICATLIR